MKKIFSIIVAFHFFFGTVALPYNDFDYIIQLPAMYRHCKATEDKDMGLIDFIKDHLLNIDCIFDSHANGDHQKPHRPFNLAIQDINSFIFLFNMFHFMNHTILYKEINFNIIIINFYHSPFINSIFHPPTL